MPTLDGALHDEGAPIPDLVVGVVGAELLEDFGDNRIRLATNETGLSTVNLADQSTTYSRQSTIDE